MPNQKKKNRKAIAIDDLTPKKDARGGVSANVSANVSTNRSINVSNNRSTSAPKNPTMRI